MTRILYATDKHIKKKNPRARIDDYFEEMLIKQEFETDLGIELGVDLYLDGGDLFDLPLQSVYEVNRVADIWRRRKAPTIGVLGNHPIRGNAEAWRPYSGVTILQNMGLLSLSDDPFLNQLEIDGFVFRLPHIDLVREPMQRGSWVPMTWDQYDPGLADVVLISHIHADQGIKTIQKEDRAVTFVSPGAMSRGSLVEENLDRTPKILLIEILKKKLKFTFHDVPCRPPSEIFDFHRMGKLEDLVDHRADEQIQEAVDSMARGDLDELVDPMTILRMLVENRDIHPKAIELAVEIVREHA